MTDIICFCLLVFMFLFMFPSLLVSLSACACVYAWSVRVGVCVEVRRLCIGRVRYVRMDGCKYVCLRVGV